MIDPIGLPALAHVVHLRRTRPRRRHVGISRSDLAAGRSGKPLFRLLRIDRDRLGAPLRRSAWWSEIASHGNSRCGGWVWSPSSIPGGRLGAGTDRTARGTS